MAYTNNTFSRVRENEAKMGAYYTDVSHCLDLRKLFIFPKDEEVCVLEPSIGDGRAVCAITGANSNSNIKVFGVEINRDVALVTKSQSFISEVLEADFTCDVMIRKNSFSFCFSNPPYMNERSDTGESLVRLEKVFLEKITGYLKLGGILVWIVPMASFLEPGHMRMWLKNYETLSFYKFREDEYEKYKQVVVIGRRVAKHEILSQQLSLFYERFTREIEILPPNLEPSIEVLPSKESDIDLFTLRVFDSAVAYNYLSQKGIPEEANKIFNRRVSQKPFSDGELKRPPIPLKKDSLYLLATSGAGQGIAGSEETLDLHLQRGVAEVVEDVNYSEMDPEDEDNGMEEGSMTVVTRTAISMHIIQNDGTISTLS